MHELTMHEVQWDCPCCGDRNLVYVTSNKEVVDGMCNDCGEASRIFLVTTKAAYSVDLLEEEN